MTRRIETAQRPSSEGISRPTVLPLCEECSWVVLIECLLVQGESCYRRTELTGEYGQYTGLDGIQRRRFRAPLVLRCRSGLSRCVRFCAKRDVVLRAQGTLTGTHGLQQEERRHAWRIQ